jgi:hypothetical protein
MNDTYEKGKYGNESNMENEFGGGGFGLGSYRRSARSKLGAIPCD